MNRRNSDQAPRDDQDTALALMKPRLEYPAVVKTKFGYDEMEWFALTEAIFPTAQSPGAVVLALAYCNIRNLDPFKRCVHIVPIWDKERGRYVDTVWPGIGEIRTTAHRTTLYAGREPTEFGPDVEKTWEGSTGGYQGKRPEPYKFTLKFAEWAQVTVYRMVAGKLVGYPGPRVYWEETCGTIKDGSPNSMWRTRPRGQHEKCAEAAALRAAFPEEVGNEYCAAEAHVEGVKQVDSTVVETVAENGNAGVRQTLKERMSKNKPVREDGEDPSSESAAAEQALPLEEERDEATAARAEQMKEDLREAPTEPAGGRNEEIDEKMF